MTAAAHASPGPADPDLQLAQDPRAGAGRLMVLAGNRPDLRGVIVDNPGCSPELRAWVSRMGGASAGSGRGGRHGADDAASWTDDADDADNADNADNSVSLAPTGWEPSDIGLGDDPFGSVLGDPLMGSPLFDDGGDSGQESASAEPAGAAGRDGRERRRSPSGRTTAKPRNASARTASRTAAARVSPSPVPPPQRPSVTMPPRPAPMPPGRFAPTAPFPVPGTAGPVGAAPGRAEDNPWAAGETPAAGAPSAAGAPGASFGVGGDDAPPSLRTARRPAPSSQPSTSPAKVVGWVFFVLLFIIIRACNG